MGSSVTQCNQGVNDFLSISLQVDVTNDSGINGDFPYFIDTDNEENVSENLSDVNILFMLL